MQENVTDSQIVVVQLRQLISLMQSMLIELRAINTTKDESAGIQIPENTRPQSGILLPGEEWDTFYDGLSARARNIVVGAVHGKRLKWLGDIESRGVSHLRNCGEITTKEIIKWRDTKLEQLQQTLTD